MGSHIQVRETEDIGANAFGSGLELGGKESGGDKTSPVVGEDGTNEGVGIASGVREDPLHNCRPSLHRAEDGEKSGMLVNCLMSYVGFLELKGDGERCRRGQSGVKVVQRSIVPEETDVSEAEWLGAAGSRDVGVLA